MKMTDEKIVLSKSDIAKLLEFVIIVKDCPKEAEHLLPLAADALLSELPPWSSEEVLSTEQIGGLNDSKNNNRNES
jgi:hypothetical protein